MSYENFLLLVVLVSLLGSCTTTYWIAPPDTNVSKLSQLMAGMSIAKVNEVLEIEPYDIYTKQDDGTTILVYNYRIKDRKISTTGINPDETRNEESQKRGDPIYAKDASKAYILFQDNKMKSIITV